MDGAATPVVTASGLVKRYGEIVAVRGIDFSVHIGECFGFLGPNGAGKTTTLLAMSGELPLLGGEVIFEGEPTTAPLYRRARAGLLSLCTLHPEDDPVSCCRWFQSRTRPGQAS